MKIPHVIIFTSVLLIVSILHTISATAQQAVIRPPRPTIPHDAPVANLKHEGIASANRVGAKLTIEANSCPSTSSQPIPIAVLARNLKCDIGLMYEYVYNNIAYEPTYGSQKGALGTLLDRSGNDADQSMLLVNLWKAAGYAQVGYANIVLQMSGSELANSLDMPNNADSIVNLLIYAGIPYGSVNRNADGTLDTILIARFVAAIYSDGVWYYADPSRKGLEKTSGLSLGEVQLAMGYTISNFLDVVGGTIDSTSFSNANRVKLREMLVLYSNNLINYVNKNGYSWNISNVIGGVSIRPMPGLPSYLINSEIIPSENFPTSCYLVDGTECRKFIVLRMPGAAINRSIKLYTDEVYGHRITAFSSKSASEYFPTLLIDGQIPACVGIGTCTNVGPPTAAGQAWSIGARVSEPGQGGNADCGSDIAYTACTNLTVAAGGSYLISLGAGRVGRSMAEYHRQLLQEAQAGGGSSNSDAVLGESLSVIGYNWLAQVSAQQLLSGRLSGVTPLYRVGLGIVGQANLQGGSLQGPYVDLPINLVSLPPVVVGGPTIPVGAHNYSTAFISSLLSISQGLSSFESSVLVESQSSIPGMVAASTVNLIDNNMNQSYPGASLKTFFADGTTEGGRSAYTTSIRPQILSRYSAADLLNITNYVAGGSQVLIPQNGQVAVGLWTGAGYTAITPVSERIDIAQKITGGLSGGFPGTNVPTEDLNRNSATSFPPSANSGSISPLLNTISAPANPKIAEPIDGISGGYIYSHDDLVIGSGAFPYALPFSRTYLSSSGGYLSSTTTNKGIGNGWMHNYGSSVKEGSDPYVGLGSAVTPAVSAATSIAALFVMRDLLSITPTAQTMTLSSMVARWLTDQFTANVATVSQPDTTEQFVALPRSDGASTVTYNAPLGSSVRLTQTTAGQYTYLRKDGVILKFGPTPNGALQSWTSPSGASVNLSYSGGTLTNVTNNLGRSLALSYSGGNVTSVADGTGRTVQFTYDGHQNLVGYTSPSGAVTNYLYDTSGVYDTAGRLTQVFYPSRPSSPYLTNWYDSLGRVAHQADANNNVWNFYFAGSRSETVDPLGGHHVTYQTERGKVLSDYWVLNNGAAGTIFYRTPQQNNVVNLTTNQYDALDRLTSTRLPEGDRTAYDYEAALNPWANNIKTITRYMKNGAASPKLTTKFEYDPTYNNPTLITDPRGLVTQLNYDAATGNLLTVIADAANLRATTRFTYNSRGQVLTATDPMGVVTQNSYDGFGNLTTTVRDCCGAGHINQTATLTYDARGDIVGLTDPRGNLTRSAYDVDRRLVALTQPAAPTSLITSFFYDADGRLLNTQQSSNGSFLRQVSSTYTPTGKTATTTDANGNVTQYAYDANDRLQKVTDPLYRVTTYGYDATDRPIAVFNPAIQAGALLQYAYTPNGRLARLTEAQGNQTNYVYDGFDRLSTTRYPNLSTETLTYDESSNITKRKTRAGPEINYGYDTLNRIITKTPPSSPVVTYAYDLNGHLLSASDNSAAITKASTGGTLSASTFQFDAMNRLVGTSFSPVQAQAPPTASSASFTYGYDATNRRRSQGASDTSWWDVPASPSSTAYSANNLNQYSVVAGVTQTYDGNGSLTGDGTFTYGYDAENRLITASGPGVAASYAYDAQGRRKSKTVNSATTIFVQDPDNRALIDYDGATGAVQSWYAFGSGPNDVLARSNAGATARTSFIPDVIGSVTGTLDAGTGVLTKAGFQPYGQSAVANGSFRYTGARLDAETGLYDFRARMYSPKLGRFMQTDPIGIAGGTNLYVYVNNDPLNLTDPTGLDPLVGTVVGAVAGAFYGAAGAAAAPGSSWKSVSAGAIVGAIAGGGLGFVDPSLGVATFAFLGAVTGGAGDLVGQVATNFLEGNPALNINPGSTAGAIVGGAVSGAGGGILGRILSRVPASEWIKSAVAASISSGPAVILPLVGGAFFDSAVAPNPRK